jgi:splicing factor 3B subunit 1
VHARAWEPTPGHAEPGATTPPDLRAAALAETPRAKAAAAAAAGSRRRWDETPKTERTGAETPHSSWAETPRVDRMEEEAVVISKQVGTSGVSHVVS